MKKLTQNSLAQIEGGNGVVVDPGQPCPSGFHARGAIVVQPGTCVLTIFGGVCNLGTDPLLFRFCTENGNPNDDPIFIPL